MTQDPSVQEHFWSIPERPRNPQGPTVILVILSSFKHGGDFGDVVNRLSKPPSHEAMVDDMDEQGKEPEGA